MFHKLPLTYYTLELDLMIAVCTKQALKLYVDNLPIAIICPEREA